MNKSIFSVCLCIGVYEKVLGMLRVLKKREEGGCWVCEPLPLDLVSSRGSGWRPVWVVALMPHSLPNTLIAHSHTDSGHNTSFEEKKKRK